MRIRNQGYTHASAKRVGGSKMLHVAVFLLRSTLKSRVAVVLIGVMTVLVMLSVGTRVAVVQGGEDSFRPIRALIERADVSRMLALGTEFLKIPGPSGFADQATVLFDEEVSFGHDVPLEVLSGLIVIAVPFVALLVGASMSPRRGSPVLTLLSAPVRRVSLYLAHVMALGAVLAILCTAAWIGGASLLALTVAAPGVLIRLLSLMLVYTLLYAMVFGCLGLSLGILFRRRVTGLMAGLLLIMVLVGVMPSLKELSGRAYVANHREAYMEFTRGGDVPTDLAWYVDRGIQHTPASAIRIIFWITEAFSPIPRPGCVTCGGLQDPGRAYRVKTEVVSLAVAALLFSMIGGVAFLGKEMGEA